MMRERGIPSTGGTVDITLVTTVRGDFDALRRTARSVRRQAPGTWEWILVVPDGVDDRVGRLLGRLTRRVPGIGRVPLTRGENVEAGENEALRIARGGFIGFLDEGDTLDPDALRAVSRAAGEHPDSDVIYTDEDRVDVRGFRFEPFLKPDWSPERLLCHDYIGNLAVIRSSLVRDVGGVRQGFGAARRHDLLLRAMAGDVRVHHLRRVLHHALAPSPFARDGARRDEPASPDRRRAVEEACSRRGIDAEVVSMEGDVHLVRRRPAVRPSVSVIVPTRGSSKSVWGLDCPMIENLLLSALALTPRDDVEYVVVYDTVIDPALLGRLGRLSPNIRLVEYDEPFSFARKCNVGADAAAGDVLIIINDDMEVITPEWVDRLVAHLDDDGVGAVGPLLLLENGLVQSAGHGDSPSGPFNVARGRSPGTHRGRGQDLRVTREVTGITGACIALRRETFRALGGFDESYPGNFNDVDLCYRITERGLRILWTPDVRLFHFESQTRGILVDPEEHDHLRRDWGHRYDGDDPDPYVREWTMTPGGMPR